MTNPNQAATAQEDALVQIAEGIDAYLNGGPDREAEHINLGKALKFDLQSIRAQWIEARTQRAKHTGAQKVVKPLALASSPPKQTQEPKLPQRSDTDLAVVTPPQAPAGDEYLIAMNHRHAIIDNVGGKTVIASVEPSTLDPSIETLVYHTKADFLLRYSNRSIPITTADGDTVRKPLGQWWLGHRLRRQYRSVTFQPAGPLEVDGCLNLWRRWGVDAVAGDWSLIRNHIEAVVAGGNSIFAEYVIRWIAWSIQHPDRQAEVALILIGEKGCGKGTLGRVLQRIFGLHAFQVSSSEEVIGKFNAHLQDCVLLIADEAFWGDKYKQCAGRLQSMITEPTLTIEPKGIGRFQIRNCLHIMMLAEPGWVIPAGRHERRYAAFEVSSLRRGDKDYFKRLHQQIDAGGAEAMFFDLQVMDLGDWHPREIPEELLHGAALQKQQSHSLPPLEQWYLGLLHDGTLPGAVPKHPNSTLTRNLIEDAKEKLPRLRFNLTNESLRNFLDMDAGEGVGNVCTKYRTSAANGWAFPPLAECREGWTRIYGAVKWDNPAEEWSKKAEGDLFYTPPFAKPLVAPTAIETLTGAHPAMVGKLVRRI
jgi:hypothetical protein